MRFHLPSTVRQASASTVRQLVLGGLVLAAVASAPAAHAADTSVSINDFAFLPADVTAPVGTSLTWTNAQTGVPHTTTSLDGVWDSGILRDGGSFSFTFGQPGDFAYQCDVHPSMRGTVHIVAAAPEPAAAPAAPVESVDTAAADTADTADNADATIVVVDDAAVTVDSPSPEPTVAAPLPTPTAVPTVAPTAAPVVAPTSTPTPRISPAYPAPTPTPLPAYRDGY
jgi:plastocyanin